jgi:hypothetical protein
MLMAKNVKGTWLLIYSAYLIVSFGFSGCSSPRDECQEYAEDMHSRGEVMARDVDALAKSCRETRRVLYGN